MTTRDKYLQKTYGITEQTYSEMLLSHSGKCWICGRPPKTRKLAVDHDHKSGNVRGLLCWQCNKGLQVYGDSPDRLEKAAVYLRNAIQIFSNDK